MPVFSLILEIIGYVLKITLIIAFWFVILNSIFSWFKIKSRHPFIKLVRICIEPGLTLLRRKLPFLVQREIDFTPVLVIFFIILLHIAVVDTLLEAALRLR